jgi:hypothetical protein
VNILWVLNLVRFQIREVRILLPTMEMKRLFENSMVQMCLYLLGFPGVVLYDIKSSLQKFISGKQSELSNYDAVKIVDL